LKYAEIRELSSENKQEFTFRVTIPADTIWEVTAKNEEEAREYAVNDLVNQVGWLQDQDIRVEKLSEHE
jgi:hypothetical protein